MRAFLLATPVDEYGVVSLMVNDDVYYSMNRDTSTYHHACALGVSYFQYDQ